MAANLAIPPDEASGMRLIGSVVILFGLACICYVLGVE